MSKAGKDSKADKKAAKESDHPDASYIKREDIGVVVAKGLAVMYKTQPKNPVDFLAKWLLNYAQVEKKVLLKQEHDDKVRELKDKLEYQASVRRTENAHKLKEVLDEEEKVNMFREKIGLSSDLNDQLQDLVSFLKKKTSATAVYIGKLVSPKRPIGEGDDDNAHVDNDSPQIIHFTNATDGHDYLVDKILQQTQGLTFDVFKDDEPVEEERVLDEGEEGYQEQQERLAKAKEQPNEVLPKFVYVKEVVREPRMHFFKVPKLGSYMAIRLEYQSCLFEESLAVAVSDYVDVMNKKREQDDEKRQYYEKLEEEKGDGDDTIDQHHDKQWEEIKPQPYKTKKIQYVVCLNTLGQDREFTDEEKKTALRTVRDYRDRWEQVEQDNLMEDIRKRVKDIAHDKVYREHHEQMDTLALEKQIEEQLQPREGEDPTDDDTKHLLAKKLRFKLLTKGFYAPGQAVPKKKKK